MKGSKRKWKRRYAKLSRALLNATETKRRYFFEQITTASPSDKTLYQPFNYITQSVTDSGVIGNSIYIKGFSLRGDLVVYPTNLGQYSGPLTMYIYLVRVRDEVSTGAITEGMTGAAATINNWFSGSTDPSAWFVNPSRCKILYRKKVVYRPNAESAWTITAGATVLNPDRAPHSVPFYCKKRINRKHYFKENTSGVPDAGFFGKYHNYYWMFCYSTPLGYTDYNIRVKYTSLVQYKDP